MNNNNLDPEELIKQLKQGGMSEEQLQDLILKMQTAGLSGSIIAIENENNSEGKATIEYINYHQKLGPNPEKIPKKEIKKVIKVLENKKTKIEDKKIAIITLAHTGKIEAYKGLKEYAKKPDPELETWAKVGLDECKMFLESDILGRPVIKINKIEDI